MPFRASVCRAFAQRHLYLFPRCVEQTPGTTCSRRPWMTLFSFAISCHQRLVTWSTFGTTHKSFVWRQRARTAMRTFLGMRHAARVALEDVKIGQVAELLRLSNEPHRLSTAWAPRCGIVCSFNTHDVAGSEEFSTARRSTKTASTHGKRRYPGLIDSGGNLSKTWLTN